MAHLFPQLALEGWTLIVAGAVNYPAAELEADAIARNGLGKVAVVRNPSPEHLADLYRRASLYWHGAGLNAGEGSVAHEHFGISIVEAMSAGTVPLAHASGGPIEILAGGLQQCLWTSEEELTESTQSLLTSGSDLNELADLAIARAKDFSPERFDDRVDDLLRTIGR